jgi:hypothetical protein
MASDIETLTEKVGIKGSLLKIIFWLALLSPAAVSIASWIWSWHMWDAYDRRLKSLEIGHGYPTVKSLHSNFGWIDELVVSMIQHDPNSRLSSVAMVKRELIARGNNFVLQQQLDARTQAIIPAGTADKLQPIEIADVDWENGAFILKLNREPEEPWKYSFRHVDFDRQSTMQSVAPHAYHFSQSTCRVNVQRELAQLAIDRFKQYSASATQAHQQRLDKEAKELEGRRRENLAAELHKERLRIENLRDLRF